MRILLTNDDGIYARGLRALHRRLHREHAVTLVAPDRERSAVGHAITLHRPLRADRVKVEDGCSGWAVSGTPADCIKLAMHEILDGRPDMVIAGINAGANVGIDLNYSGTVAAAKEAALQGLPAMAVSISGTDNGLLDEAAAFTGRLAERLAARGMPAGTFLNVNFPGRPLGQAAGVRVRRQGLDPGSDRFERRVDPRNRVYYWPGSVPAGAAEGLAIDSDTDSDRAALSAAFITITPIRCDMTDYDLLAELRGWVSERF